MHIQNAYKHFNAIEYMRKAYIFIFRVFTSALKWRVWIENTADIFRTVLWLNNY